MQWWNRGNWPRAITTRFPVRRTYPLVIGQIARVLRHLLWLAQQNWLPTCRQKVLKYTPAGSLKEAVQATHKKLTKSDHHGRSSRVHACGMQQA